MVRLRHLYDLTRNLVRRDFTLRYHGSTLGILWSLLLPLAQLVVLAFLFRRVLPLGIEAYPAFIFCALLPWAWLSASLGSAGSLFLANRDLVRRPGFLPPVLVLVGTLSNLLGYLVSLPVLLVVLALYDRPLTSALLALPVLLLVQGMLTVGLGLMIATFNVFFRDVQHVVTVVLSLLFYLTPVFYRVQDAAGHGYGWVFSVNPIAVLIEAYRRIFFYGVAPPWGSLATVGIASAFLCGLAYVVYVHRQHDMVDLI